MWYNIYADAVIGCCLCVSVTYSSGDAGRQPVKSVGIFYARRKAVRFLCFDYSTTRKKFQEGKTNSYKKFIIITNMLIYSLNKQASEIGIDRNGGLFFI